MADAVDQQRDFFASLLVDAQVAVVVATGGSRVAGSLLRGSRVPPGSDTPGGSTCLVDDLAVDAETDWPGAGLALIAELERWGAAHGAVQSVIGHRSPGRGEAARPAPAAPRYISEWSTGPI